MGQVSFRDFKEEVLQQRVDFHIWGTPTLTFLIVLSFGSIMLFIYAVFLINHSSKGNLMLQT